MSDTTREANGSAAATAARVLFIFAHPDDEAFGLAGTIALLRERKVDVTLVTATRGEVGQILVPSLATPETLGAVRELELRAAMAEVGVHDVRFLGYRDSGMAGTPENEDPRAFVQAPEAEVVALLVAQIRSLRPNAIVTFGPEGIYGHPDHVAVSRRTMAAIHVAAGTKAPAGLGEPWRVGALYFSALPRERIEAMRRRFDGPFRSATPEMIAMMGTRLAEITTVIPVAEVYEKKRAVLECHRTQIGETGPYAGIPADVARQWMSYELLRREPLPWSNEAGLPSDPIAALAAELPATVADLPEAVLSQTG